MSAPLDLPVGARADSEEEETETETINFYGMGYEGDGFFWCLDRSGSMMGMQLMTLQAEVSGAVEQLSHDAEFGLVKFNDGHDAWRIRPSRASKPNKALASAWINELDPGGGTCIASACIATLGIANQSRKRSVQVILVGDGMPSCNESTTQDVRFANYRDVPIHTLFIGNNMMGQGLFQTIATENGGSFMVAGGMAGGGGD